jgi:threonine/homoserine/homoserine lactone efflux protein
MTTALLLAYSLAILLAVSTPGPSGLSVASAGVTRGTAAASQVALGVALADIALVTIAMAGLAAIVQTHEQLLIAIKFAGAGYLAWSGYRLWRAAREPRSEQTQSSHAASLLMGFSVAIGNPKAILFHASLMPTFFELTSLTLMQGSLVIAIVFCANILGMGGYVLAGRYLQSRVSGRGGAAMNRVSALAMMGAGAAVLVL